MTQQQVAEIVNIDLVADTIRAAKGNVPQQTKDTVALWWLEKTRGHGFARPLCARLVVSEMSTSVNLEAPGKKFGRMVFETAVMPGEFLVACHALNKA